MNDEQKLELYYNDINNQIKIATQLKNKETIFLNKQGMIIRGIKADSINYLLKNMDYYRFYKNKYNLYNSIAIFRNFPVFSWKKDHRKKQYDIWTGQKKYLPNITDYSFYMDFDNKDDNFELCKNETMQVSDYLNSKKVKHIIIFSGSGFHIKAEMVKDQKNPETTREVCKRIMDKFLLKTPDTSIYRWQGIIKTLWSVDTKTMRVCRPIRRDLLDDFKPEHVHIDNYIGGKI